MTAAKARFSAEGAEERRGDGAVDDESSRYVHDSDLYATYGMQVADREVSKDPVVTHSVFHLAGPGSPLVEVFVCDHRKHPGMAAEDEAAWRSSGDVSDIAGLGTAAFQTPDGALFARLDGSWTVQILAPEIAQARPAAAHVPLMERILARLETAPPDR